MDLLGIADTLIQGILLGSLYALFALGLSLMFGVMRIVNTAHGDLVVLAGFGGFFLTRVAGIGPFTAMLAIGSLGLFWESSIGLWDLWFSLYFVFSGYLFPLALFPEAIHRWVSLSPFPYTLAFPVETMLGLTTRADLLERLATQYAYGLGFLALALWLWRRGLVRYAAYGG